MIPLKDDVEANSGPYVMILLIIANFVAFVFFCGQPESVITQWSVVPQRMTSLHDAGQMATLFTAMFMHGGFLHILGNMWFLWIFGDNVEDRMGHLEFLLFYLLCGVAGGVAQILLDPHSTMPMLGASGAIAGVMGAYIVLYPGAKIRMLWDDFWLWTFQWPAWAVIGEWWLMQYLLGVVWHDTSSHIGYYAHLGGFAAGMILILMFARPEKSGDFRRNY